MSHIHSGTAANGWDSPETHEVAYSGDRGQRRLNTDLPLMGKTVCPEEVGVGPGELINCACWGFRVGPTLPISLFNSTLWG